MRLIATLLLFVSFFQLNGQESKIFLDALKADNYSCLLWKAPSINEDKMPNKTKAALPVAKTSSIDTGKNGRNIIANCRSSFGRNIKPLIVIDGIPYGYPEQPNNNPLSNLNPNDIESIDIFKETDMPSFGCRRSSGVIVITTKNSKLRKFIIKDFLDGSKIAGASVSFIGTIKTDTLMIAANDSGVVVTDKLIPGENYQVDISAVGYKVLNQTFKNSSINKESELLLEREIKNCDNVTLTSYVNRKTGCGFYCRCSGIYITFDSIVKLPEPKTITSLNAYPNPVAKGGIFNISYNTSNKEKLTIKLLTANGQQVYQNSPTAYQGENRFSMSIDPRWTAGIYIIQLYANGKFQASNKIIIQ